MRYRLLALDLDGTLLDPYGALTPGVKGAVTSAVDRGLRVVICTGRRFRGARPMAEALGLMGPVVAHNGVLVKRADTGETLHANYMPAALVRDAVEL